MTSTETAKQRAKRLKLPYIRLVIDTRWSEQNGQLIDFEGPQVSDHLVQAAKALLMRLVSKTGSQTVRVEP